MQSLTNLRRLVVFPISNLQVIVFTLAAGLHVEVFKSDSEGMGGGDCYYPHALDAGWVTLGVVRTLKGALTCGKITATFCRNFIVSVRAAAST